LGQKTVAENENEDIAMDDAIAANKTPPTTEHTR